MINLIDTFLRLMLSELKLETKIQNKFNFHFKIYLDSK